MNLNLVFRVYCFLVYLKCYATNDKKKDLDYKLSKRQPVCGIIECINELGNKAKMLLKR